MVRIDSNPETKKQAWKKDAIAGPGASGVHPSKGRMNSHPI
jgi:hypothetical protein